MTATVTFGARIAAADDLKFVDVFTGGTDGYHTYRIPALLVTPKGTLLAFCEGRKTGSGDHGDLDMVLKRSTDSGATWSAQQIVHEEGGDKKITIGNPCPVVDQHTGVIWLPFTRDNDDVFVTSSNDDGVTWAPPTLVTNQVKDPAWGWYATGPGVGIQLTRGKHKGRLVIPCDHRVSKASNSTTRSHVMYSDDHGKTWSFGKPVADHTNECQVVELPDGRLLMNMRNYWGRDGKRPDRGGKRAIATSSDGGETWSELQFDDELPEPVCQAGMIRYSWSDGGASRILFTNPASTSQRNQLTIRMSSDEGESWSVSKLIYAGSSAYSCPARLADGRIGVLFERDGYKKITFTAFGVDWLTEKK